MTKQILIVIGTRPNFIKVTQFKKLSQKYPGINIKIVHTGQHFDDKMSKVFFEQFGLEPDFCLNIMPASPNMQIAEIMTKLEDLVDKVGRPDIILVPGDVNSTLAGALFANKMGITLGHIEAGLRSFDRTMPEEHNRKVTDELSDIYFVTEPSGMKHLLAEGKKKEQVYFVGNTMIDTMLSFEDEIDASKILSTINVDKRKFILMTMHRPATVDSREEFGKLVQLIEMVSGKYKIVFPIHPRTIKMAKEFDLYDRMIKNSDLICTAPLDYFAFQKLIKECAFIITDSGGIQEESTFRRKACLTIRPNTERPVTVEQGTNTLLTFDLGVLKGYIEQIENGSYKQGQIPELWDGKATERIMAAIDEL